MLMKTEQAGKGEGVSRAVAVSGAGILFWFIFVQYLRQTYGPGAPFFITTNPSSNPTANSLPTHKRPVRRDM